MKRTNSSTRLYIHIGTHKTGSTAIQSAINRNCVALRKEGITYLPLPELNGHALSRELDEKLLSRYKNHIGQGIGKRNNEDERFLCSREGYSGDPISGYENAHVIAKNLRKLTAELDVRIIVYLRRQDDFIESLYTQKIQEGESCTFESFVEAIDPLSFDYERLLRCYSEFFGKQNIIARRYDKAFLPEKNSLLNDFAQIIGSNSLKLEIDFNAPNRGYSRDSLEIARLVNPYLKPNEKWRLRQILQKTSSKQPFECFSFWDHKKRQQILAEYSKSNSIVAREYFDEPTGILFPILDPQDSCQPYPGISVDAAVVVLAKAIVAEPESYFLRAVLEGERKLLELLGKFPKLKSIVRDLGRKFGML